MIFSQLHPLSILSINLILSAGNALQAAAAAGHSNIVDLLLENKPPALVDTPGGHYGSALMAAICSGNVDIVWALLDEKAHPDVKSKTYGLPLEKAATMGQGFKEIVALLLDNHAEADWSPKGTGVHILHRAAMYDMVDLVELCLDRGCQIDMITTEGPVYPRRSRDLPREMTPLDFACAEGHEEMVDFLLSRKAPYELDKPRSAPLWIAAYQGHARVVELLLTRFKANHSKEQVNQFLQKQPHPEFGHPILYAAVSSGDPDTVRVLLDHGTQYQANWFNATPLLATASFGCPNVTRVLLEYHERHVIDIQINKQANHGRTALIEACALNRQGIEKMLLDAGANYMLADEVGATALHFATNHENDNVCKILLEKAASDGNRQRFLEFLNIRHRKSGRTALIDCVARNRPERFQMLLDYGANYDITGYAGNNPLLIAAQGGHNGMIEALLKKVKHDSEAEPQRFYDYINWRNNDGKTAVYSASEGNHPTTVKLLLEAGADYTITNTNDQSLLNPACWNGHRIVVKTVLEFLSENASPEDTRKFLNHRNKWGITALFEAVTKQIPEPIELLLAQGSDYTIPRDSGVTVLHFASFGGHLGIVERLLNFVTKRATKEQFLAFINQRNKAKKTALVDACQNGGPQITALLLDRGADYTIPDENGFTALHFCAFRNKSSTVRVLLDKTVSDRTSPSTENKAKFFAFLNRAGSSNGRSALCDVAFQNFTHLVRELLEVGADWDCPDKEGMTPAHWACRHGNQEMYRLLAAAAGVVDGENNRLEGEQRLAAASKFYGRQDKHGESVLMAAMKKGFPVKAEAPNGKA